MAHSPNHPYADERGYVFEHRLVAEGMIGRHLLPEEVVHHINEDRSDNRPENLQVFTSQGEHFSRHRREVSCLKEWHIPYIRALLAAGISQRDIAAAYGVHQGTISSIATGRTWADVKGSDDPQSR